MLVVRLGVEGLGGEEGFLGKSNGTRRILTWSFELTVLGHIFYTFTTC